MNELKINGVGIEFRQDCNPDSETKIAKMLIDSVNVSIDKDELIAAVSSMSASQEDKKKMIEAAEVCDTETIWRLLYKYLFPIVGYFADNTALFSFLIEYYPMFKDIL